MAIWDIDLTTHDGAQSAAQMGAWSSFGAAVLTAIGIALAASLTRTSDVDSMATLGGAVVEGAVFIIAGFRFRAGKGAVWGSAAALLLAIEIAMKLAAFSIGGIFVNFVLTVGIVNGVRAALAFRRGIDDPDSLAETFS